MASSLKHRSLKGMFWALSESTGAAVVSLASFLILARLLDPVDFGVVAFASSFILLFNFVIGHTFADPLVQAREVDEGHVQTAFWSTQAVALALAAACGVAADSIARLLGEPRVADVLVWLALIMPINAFGSVQMAMLRRDLRFREVATATLAGRTVGGAVGVGMAFMGFGAWSLVGQQLSGAFVINLVIAVIGGGIPRLRFSVARFRVLAGFGIHVSGSHVLTAIGEQAATVMVGTLFGTLVLGYFNLAWRTVQLLRSLISSAMYHVGFSAFSRLQDDREALASSFSRATQLSCLVGFPLGFGLAVTADHAIALLYGAKWAASVPILGWLALQLVPSFFSMFFAAFYRARGRPDWVLYLTFLDLLVTVGGIIALAGHPVQWVAALWVVKAVAFLPIELYLLSRLLEAPIAVLVKPVYVPLAATLLMAMAVEGVDAWIAGASPAVALAVEVAVGLAAYWLAIRIMAPTLQRFALTTFKTMASVR